MDKRRNTHMAKREDREIQWFEIDATGKTLGRLATEIANILRGKHRPDYTPHADTGDGVIVVNADKFVVTGMKEARKEYHWYTHHIGGLRSATLREMRERKPLEPLRHAVHGMVPRTRLGRAQMKRLRLFIGGEHDMQAQTPAQVGV